MKISSIVFLIAAYLISNSISAQAEPKFVYCQIIATGKWMSNKVTVELDFGQKMKVFADNRLKGKDGKPLKFNTNIDAMNYLGKQGWEVVQTYTAVNDSGMGIVTYTYYTIMKKPFSELDEEAKKAYLEGENGME